MSCRKGTNAALTGSAAAITGAPTVVVEKAFHALKREGARLEVPSPAPDEVVAFLRRRRDLLKDTDGIPEHRKLLHKVKLSQAREAAEQGIVPDGPTWHAWQKILAESEVRAEIRRREAVIIDIDGTVANSEPMAAIPYPAPGESWDEWYSHTPNLQPNDWVRDATQQIGDDAEKVIITARAERYRDITEAWLDKHDVAYDKLVMRPHGDMRPDHEFKQEALDELERDREFLYAMEDNPQVAAMWAENDIETIVVPGYGAGKAPEPDKANDKD